MTEIDNMTAWQCALLLTPECYYVDKETKACKKYGFFASVVLLSNHLQNITVLFKKVAWKIYTGEPLVTNEDIARRVATLLESADDEADVAKLKLLASRAMLCVGDRSPQGQELQQALLSVSNGTQPDLETLPKGNHSDVSTSQLKRMLVKTDATYKEAFHIYLRRIGFFLATGSIITNEVLAHSILNKIRDPYEVFSESAISNISELAKTLHPRISNHNLAQQLSDIKKKDWIELTIDSSPNSSDDEKEEDHLIEHSPSKSDPLSLPITPKSALKIDQGPNIEVIEEIEFQPKLPEPPLFVERAKKMVPPLPKKKTNAQKLDLSVLKARLKDIRAVVEVVESAGEESCPPTPQDNKKITPLVSKNSSKKNIIFNKPNPPGQPTVVRVLFQENQTQKVGNTTESKSVDTQALQEVKLRKVEIKDNTLLKNDSTSSKNSDLVLMVKTMTKYYYYSPAKSESDDW